MAALHNVEYDRHAIAAAILNRLDNSTSDLARTKYASTHSTQWFEVDDLLPQPMARAIYAAFPPADQMIERYSLREHKYVAAQMNRYNPQAEEALFAFHDDRIVSKIASITGLTQLQADPKLYAGGISLMTKHNFLNPHVDNSHDNDRALYRVLNLLYYVSPDWQANDGGHLELWPNGVRGKPLTIQSLFNRLVVMATGPESWHSVCRVERDASRCCVSNYYFSPQPLGGSPYFRVTSFRGRPEQPVRNLLLLLDAKLRQAVRFFQPKGIVRTRQIYK
jgi:Rps23 Pro-64 3,4-dihydroxylase Tpa1-like proline 4-hydroxylase